MDVELITLPANGNNGKSISNDRITAENGADVTCEVTERDSLLKTHAAGNQNGDIPVSNSDVEAQRTVENAHSCPESTARRIWEELNDTPFSKVRLWMILIFLLVIIVAIILFSLWICSVIHEDVDEKFDPSLFQVPLHFNGSFQLPNQVFTEELFTLSTNESIVLTTDLEDKLADLYRSSPALGRYFSKAEVYSLRNGSVIADYQLTFLLPEEQQFELQNFTLSREMVYNVLRQSLYDQETDGSAPMYIYPRSLRMF
ncbi:TPA-induced transmembrane protein homolog [Cynoglossus semilaevis]|uniref:Chromosome 4 C3orf52 homolog n=1 Tax=Cynoglossus semilaevis TaxID=244447 RepID=A0A3P8V7G2_CYNSE|nr:TPA-induced transmembrane protein [Cynoglossus semilaevis]